MTVNAVAPTFIRTPGTAERLDDPEFLAGVLERIPIGRVGTTTDVAGAVVYLASPAAALVNGGRAGGGRRLDRPVVHRRGWARAAPIPARRRPTAPKGRDGSCHGRGVDRPGADSPSTG